MKSFLLSLCSNMYYLFIYFSLKNTIQKFGNSLNILRLLFHLLHNVFFSHFYNTVRLLTGKQFLCGFVFIQSHYKRKVCARANNNKTFCGESLKNSANTMKFITVLIFIYLFSYIFCDLFPCFTLFFGFRCKFCMIKQQTL